MNRSCRVLRWPGQAPLQHEVRWFDGISHFGRARYRLAALREYCVEGGANYLGKRRRYLKGRLLMSWLPTVTVRVQMAPPQ